MWVNKVVGNKLQRMAEYKISPDNGNFLFAIPKDEGAAYRLQVNLYKPGGRHPKLDKIAVLPLPLNPGHHYTLKNYPFKIRYP